MYTPEDFFKSKSCTHRQFKQMVNTPQKQMLCHWENIYSHCSCLLSKTMAPDSHQPPKAAVTRSMILLPMKHKLLSLLKYCGMTLDQENEDQQGPFVGTYPFDPVKWQNHLGEHFSLMKPVRRLAISSKSLEKLWETSKSKCRMLLFLP